MATLFPSPLDVEQGGTRRFYLVFPRSPVSSFLVVHGFPAVSSSLLIASCGGASLARRFADGEVILWRKFLFFAFYSFSGKSGQKGETNHVH